MFAVKQRPFNAIPQVIKRGEDGTVRPAFVVRKQSRNVFKEKKRRPFGFNQSGNLKDESSSRVFESGAPTGDTKRLTRKTAAQQLKFGHFSGVDASGVWIVDLLLPDVVHGAVACVRVLIYLTVSDTFKASGTVQTGTETANP